MSARIGVRDASPPPARISRVAAKPSSRGIWQSVSTTVYDPETPA